MSTTLKRQQFQTQIRRQSIRKILQQKKYIYQTQKQVNQTFINHIHNNIDSPLPKICVLKFQFLNQENKNTLINLVRQKQIKLDFSKPQNIALINKISLTQENIVQLFLQEITVFADKMIFSLSGNQNLWNGQKDRKSFPNPGSKVIQNLIFFPNCLLQFWGKCFFIKERGLQIETYCVILKAFIYWFGSKSTFFKHFNKYSFCLFMENFLKFQNILTFRQDYRVIKPVEQLFIKFRYVSTSIIGMLLEEGFISDQFLEIMNYLTENQCQKSLLKCLSCKIQKKKTFFTHLMNILEDDSYQENRQIKSQFLYSQQIDEDKLQTLTQYSIQSMKSENLVPKIWQRKVKILAIMNQYLNFEEYQEELLKSNLKWIVQRLFCVYIYCEQRGNITEKIQKSISILMFNIIILVQNSIFQCKHANEQTEVEWDNHNLQSPSQNSHQISDQDQMQRQQKIQTENILKEYFIEQFNVKRIVQKSSFLSYQQTVEFLSLLNEISTFLNNKDFDRNILESDIIEKISNVLKDKIFNHNESQLIIQALFEILSNLHKKHFAFAEFLPKLQQFKNPEIKSLFSENQQSLIDAIFSEIQQKVYANQ